MGSVIEYAKQADNIVHIHVNELAERLMAQRTPLKQEADLCSPHRPAARLRDRRARLAGIVDPLQLPDRDIDPRGLPGAAAAARGCRETGGPMAAGLLTLRVPSRCFLP